MILRWLPLLRCPLRPAPGHADLHDVGGATVHDQPLDNNTRHKVLQETLGLLRGQNKLAAMVDRNMYVERAERGGPARSQPIALYKFVALFSPTKRSKVQFSRESWLDRSIVARFGPCHSRPESD